MRHDVGGEVDGADAMRGVNAISLDIARYSSSVLVEGRWHLKQAGGAVGASGGGMKQGGSGKVNISSGTGCGRQNL